MKINSVSVINVKPHQQTKSKQEIKMGVPAEQLQSSAPTFKGLKNGLKMGGLFLGIGAIFGAIFAPVGALVTAILTIAPILGTGGFLRGLITSDDKNPLETNNIDP